MLWTFKMVYLVPTQYFLIQLQLINNFFNSLTNEKGVSNESVTMHSSIIIFACFIHFQSLSVPSLRLFRTFLYLLSNRAKFLTFAFPKRTRLFLLQDLPAEACRSGQFHLCSAEEFLKRFHVVYNVIEFIFFLRNRSSVEI